MKFCQYLWVPFAKKELSKNNGHDILLIWEIKALGGYLPLWRD